MFVKVYYVVSPSIALIIAKSEQLKYLTRKTLTPIVEYFKRKYRSIRITKTHDSTCV